MSQRSLSSNDSQRSVTSASKKSARGSPSAKPAPGQGPPDKTTYTVAVRTSDVKNAGTDANVYVQLTGANGIGPQMHLKTSLNHRNKFERKRSDVFVFHEQKPLGALKQLRIWHDNGGIGPGWHLQVVEVNDSSGGVSYVFPCNQWLCKKEGDRQISRVLPCARTKEKIPKQLRVAAEMQQQKELNKVDKASLSKRKDSGLNSSRDKADGLSNSSLNLNKDGPKDKDGLLSSNRSMIAVEEAYARILADLCLMMMMFSRVDF